MVVTYSMQIIEVVSNGKTVSYKWQVYRETERMTPQMIDWRTYGDGADKYGYHPNGEEKVKRNETSDAAFMRAADKGRTWFRAVEYECEPRTIILGTSNKEPIDRRDNRTWN